MLKQLEKYDRLFNTRRLRAWLLSMEQYLQASKVPLVDWVLTVGTYFKDFAVTWYTRWKAAKEGHNEPLTWEDFAKQVMKDLTPKDPEWAARLSMAKLEYQGNLKKHITLFHELAQDVQDMGIPDWIFNFVKTLPKKLAIKLAEKRKQFKTLNDCFGEATQMVASKPNLERTEKSLDKKGEFKPKNNYGTNTSGKK